MRSFCTRVLPYANDFEKNARMQNIMSERTRKKLKLSPLHDKLHRKTERDCLLFVVVVDDDDVVIAFNCWWGDLFFIEPRGFYAERGEELSNK